MLSSAVLHDMDGQLRHPIKLTALIKRYPDAYALSRIRKSPRIVRYLGITALVQAKRINNELAKKASISHVRSVFSMV